MAVFRGIGEDAAVAIGRALAAGRVIRRRSFMSTGIDPAPLSRFGYIGWLTILLPAGLRGVAYVHHFPRIQHAQYEMLLRPGLALRVVRAEGNRFVLEVAE